MATSVTVRVPAKVNLHLSVGPLRADGFHDLTTVFHAVSLHDDVVAAPADGLSCVVRGEGAQTLTTGADNLAVRAAAALARSVGVEPAVALELVKGIPVAGGMAGGSADAAGALVACDALWQTGTSREDLLTIAAELGSDVPFCLLGGTALGTGRGEQVTPVLVQGEYHWVFALAGFELSTPRVYAEHDASPPTEGPGPDGVLSALRSGDAVALGRALHNDLQAAALRLRPALRRTLDAGLEAGALGAVVCGSGPTCAFLARSRSDAVALAAALSAEGVCRSVRSASGPVPGARVLA
jgi:4-diphosphocytidyl-2-C-methyl-D-erythritol kinase